MPIHISLHSKTKALLTVAMLLALLSLPACTPELNWRDIRAGAGENAGEVSLQFPCKPRVAQRKLLLGDNKDDTPVSFTLTGCSAGDMSFALGAADMGDASRVDNALQWMAAKLAQNIGTSLPKDKSALITFQPKGASASAYALRTTLSGKRPDGAAVTEHIAVFAQGSRVYQATVVVAPGKDKREAVDNFFSSIGLQP